MAWQASVSGSADTWRARVRGSRRWPGWWLRRHDDLVTTTPLWVPLLVAAIGMVGAVGGTIGGVIITQRRADKREAVTWGRQQQREREAWAREDATRTFEHRREAYANFYAAHRDMTLLVYDHGMGLRDVGDQGDVGVDEDGDLMWGWQLPVFQRLQDVELYGSALVREAATTAYGVTCAWGAKTKYGQADDTFDDGSVSSDNAQSDLLAAIRRDLSIPEDGQLRLRAPL